MLTPTRAVRVFAYAAPVDMRKGFDGLGALVEQQLGRQLLKGDVFLFVGRSRRRAKVLHFDGTGLVLLTKRPVTAPAPPRLIPGGRYSVDFAVHVALMKYGFHLPLARQERLYAREGLGCTPSRRT